MTQPSLPPASVFTSHHGLICPRVRAPVNPQLPLAGGGGLLSFPLRFQPAGISHHNNPEWYLSSGAATPSSPPPSSHPRRRRCRCPPPPPPPPLGPRRRRRCRPVGREQAEPSRQMRRLIGVDSIRLPWRPYRRRRSVVVGGGVGCGAAGAGRFRHGVAVNTRRRRRDGRARDRSTYRDNGMGGFHYII